jgi:hypothetical protein
MANHATHELLTIIATEMIVCRNVVHETIQHLLIIIMHDAVSPNQQL